MRKTLINIIRYLKAPFGVLGVLLCFSLQAQFAPAAGLPGSTAIDKDSSVFVDWASGCSIQRGYMDIAQPDSGYASIGDSHSAIGKAGLNGVVSLGDAGVATLTFQSPIFNGAGFDFAVFENGFYTQSPLAFLEFAFVEVSSDGNNFFRFSPTSHIQDTTQMAMIGVDCSLVNNLAGKYVFGYGTPFDLEELKSEIGLDVNSITHVRVIDVVGTIAEQFATHDQSGNKINDPYPTLFASSGFDLDAVGVIHSTGINSVEEFQVSGFSFQVYPNPCLQNSECNLKVDESFIGSSIEIFDAMGNLLSKNKIATVNGKLQTTNLATGIYFLRTMLSSSRLIIE